MLGEPNQDDTKKFLHKIKRKENDVRVSVPLDEEPEDETELCIIVLCIRKKNQNFKIWIYVVTFITSRIFMLHVNKGLDIYAALYLGA